jgi:hypothetical protein
VANLFQRRYFHVVHRHFNRRHPAMTFIPAAESAVSLHAMAKNGILAHREYAISVRESMY